MAEVKVEVEVGFIGVQLRSAAVNGDSSDGVGGRPRK